MFEESRWNAAFRAIGARPDPALLSEIVARYGEPHRAYHTHHHLAECFAAFDQAKHLGPRPAEVELALFFHDAIYDTRAPDSEERSACWAYESLLAAGADEDVAARVRDLVRATKHAGEPHDADARLLLDVDLSILGASPMRFVEYERQVRQEYEWVPEEAFRQARSRILRSFLDRPRLYSTPWFETRLEVRARTNLTDSLRLLAGER